MLNPAIPADPRTALALMRDVVLASEVSSKPRSDLRYVRDDEEPSPFVSAEYPDVWQTPEQTDARGAGDCEDLTIRWAAWLSRQQPMTLCISQMGEHTWHYWIELDGKILDPSVLCGMPAPRPEKYTRRRFSMQMHPSMWGNDAGHGNAETAKGFGTASAITGAAATALTAVYPPAGLIAGGVSAALGLVGGLFSQAAENDAKKAKAAPPAKNGRKRRPRRLLVKRVAAAPPHKIASVAQARLSLQVEPKAISRARGALALVSAAKSDRALQQVLDRNLSRAPTLPDGSPDPDLVTLRMAAQAAQLDPRLLPPQSVARQILEVSAAADADALDDADSGEGDDEACCASCATGGTCEASAGNDGDDGEGDDDGDGDDDAEGDNDDGDGDDDAEGDEDDGDGDDDAEGDDDDGDGDDDAEGDDDDGDGDDDAEGDEDDGGCASGACGAGDDYDDDEGDGDDDEDDSDDW